MSQDIVKAMDDLYGNVSFGGGGRGGGNNRSSSAPASSPRPRPNPAYAGGTNNNNNQSAGAIDAALCVGIVGLTNNWGSNFNGGLGAMALCGFYLA